MTSRNISQVDITSRPDRQRSPVSQVCGLRPTAHQVTRLRSSYVSIMLDRSSKVTFTLFKSSEVKLTSGGLLVWYLSFYYKLVSGRVCGFRSTARQVTRDMLSYVSINMSSQVSVSLGRRSSSV